MRLSIRSELGLVLVLVFFLSVLLVALQHFHFDRLLVNDEEHPMVIQVTGHKTAQGAGKSAPLPNFRLLPKDQVEHALNKALHGVYRKRVRLDPDGLVSPPKEPLIMLYWPPEPEGGWWPWDRPRTLQQTITPECRVRCRFISMDAPPDMIRSADAVVFHLPHAALYNFTPVHYESVYGHRSNQSYWGFMLESFVNYWQLDNPQFLNSIDFWMTHRRDSHVPTTYANRVWSQSFHTAPPPLKGKRTDALAIFISSNCFPSNDRLIWAKALIEAMPVHSYGKCAHNKDIPSDGGQDSREKIALMSTYKFCLAFENRCEEDYVSEKFFHALAAGCLPVYMGAPNIREYLPSPDAIIRTDDFETPEKLAEFLKALAENETEYNRRLSWKEQGLGATRLIQLQALSYPTAPCRLCEYMAGVDSTRTIKEQQELYTAQSWELMKQRQWRLMHDSAGVPLPPTQPPPREISDGDGVVLPTQKGQSCADACTDRSTLLRCDAQGLDRVNNCEALEIFFSCYMGCKLSNGHNRGLEQPAFISPTSIQNAAMCLLFTDPDHPADKHLNCDAKYHDSYRLCPCSRIPPPPPQTHAFNPNFANHVKS